MLKPGSDLTAGFGKPVVVAELGYDGDESYVTDRIEAPEQPIEGAGPHQLLTEQPDGIGVRHRINARPAKRMNDSRSRIWYSVWSSDRV